MAKTNKKEKQVSTLEQIGNKLMQLSFKSNNFLDEYLDHLLHVLCIIVMDAKKVDKDFMELAYEGLELWMDTVLGGHSPFDGNKIALNIYDFIGSLIEVWTSRGKKSAFGQFFTPEHICEFMSHIVGASLEEQQQTVITRLDVDGDIYEHQEKQDRRIFVSDPCCGSSRMLLAEANRVRKAKAEANLPLYIDNYFFAANDLDYMACKMSLINFWLHGLSGEITNANGLFMQSDYRWGYSIECIPIAKWVQQEYPKILARKLDEQPKEEGIDAEGNDIKAKWFSEYLKWRKELPSMQDVFDYHYNSYIWFSEVDTKRTIYSPAGDNHFRVIKQITKEQSVQVAIEHDLYVKREMEIQKEKQENKPLEKPIPVPSPSLFDTPLEEKAKEVKKKEPQKTIIKQQDTIQLKLF